MRKSTRRFGISFLLICCTALLAMSAAAATASARTAPTVQLDGPYAALTIDGGAGFMCASIRMGQGASCWGYNNNAQLGGNSGASTNYVSSHPTGFAMNSIASGESFNCGINSNLKVACWGLNTYGQTGQPTAAVTVPVDTVPASLSGTAPLDVVAGARHACVLTSAGGIKCWGYGNTGALGNMSSATTYNATDVPGFTSGVTSIAAGSYHTCAVTTAGAIYCWGSNGNGELGNGSTIANFYQPIRVSGADSGFSKVYAGGSTTCAVKTTGQVYCWGLGTSGQLGNGTNASFNTPVLANLTGSVARIDIGTNYACALMSATGGVKCWGGNNSGQLGNGSTAPTSTPADVTGLTSGVRLLGTGNNTTCVVTNNNQFKCWGNNSTGQVGLGTNSPSSVTTPQVAIQALNYARISYIPTDPDFVVCQFDQQDNFNCPNYGSMETTGLVFGRHTARIDATNTAGTGTLITPFLYDALSPYVVSVTSPSTTLPNSRTATLGFSIGDSGSATEKIECRYAAGTSAANAAWRYCVSGDMIAPPSGFPGAGTYTLEIRLTDRVGNVSTSVRTFTVS